MSIFSSIDADVHNFAHWAEKELGKLSTDAPAIEKTADTILQYVGGVAGILAGIEGGPAASAVVTRAVGTLQTGVVALSGLITDFGPSPTAATIANSLATNAASLLSAAHVTNEKSVKAATTIVSNLNLLATALTAASASTPAPAPATTVA